MREHQKAELIQQVLMLAEELGRAPTAGEFNKDSRTASFSAVQYHFGSWNRCIEAAGLEVNKKHSEISGEEQLVQQVQMLAEELGRAPTKMEFNNDPRTVSALAAMNRFGSWNKFLEAAGLRVNLIMDDDLIEQIQMLARELGRAPTMMEFNKDPRTASSSTAQYHFGSWNRCIEAAGLEVNKAGCKAGCRKNMGLTRRRAKKFSNEELIRQILILSEELGRVPTALEFKKDPRAASINTVIDRFGSWNNSLEAAGLRVNLIMDDDLIEQIQMLARELGRAPTAGEFNKDSRTASAVTAMNRFGSWNNSLEAAGLRVNKKRVKISSEELIQQAQMLAEELGRAPKIREFNNDPRTASSNAARNHFGSWNKFLEAAGLKTWG